MAAPLMRSGISSAGSLRGVLLSAFSADIMQASETAAQLLFVRNASKKAGGSSSNGRDSNPKNLGLKKYGGQKVIPGNIIVRQRGTQFHRGNFVGMGKDHTLFALLEGKVRFHKDKLTGRKTVHVEPVDAQLPVHPAYAGSKWETALSQSGQQGIKALLAELKAKKACMARNTWECNISSPSNTRPQAVRIPVD